MEIFGYTFFQNALLGCLLASLLCSFVGTYIVTRRLVFISGGITHASFGGIGLGIYYGINPILSALVFAVASAFGVQWMTTNGKVREDSAIAMFWTLGMSIGIIFSFLTPGVVTDISSYIFGNVLTITSMDIGLLAVLTIITALLFIFFGRTIMLVAFDAEYARSLHVPVKAIEYVMMMMIAMTVVSTLRMVGIVLAISMLTIPQMTANAITRNFRMMIPLSAIFALIYSITGLIASYWLNVPSGACIIFVSILFYGVVKAIKHAIDGFKYIQLDNQ